MTTSWRDLIVNNITLLFIALTSIFALHKSWRDYLKNEQEKQKAVLDTDILKIKEQSVGASAIAMIFKEVTVLKDDISSLRQCQEKNHLKDTLINSIIERMEGDIKRLMDLLFDKYKK